MQYIYSGLQGQSAACDVVRPHFVRSSHQRHLPESRRQFVQVKMRVFRFSSFACSSVSFNLHAYRKLSICSICADIHTHTHSYLSSFNMLFLVKRSSPTLSCWSSLTVPSMIWRPLRLVTFFFLLILFVSSNLFHEVSPRFQTVTFTRMCNVPTLVTANLMRLFIFFHSTIRLHWWLPPRRLWVSL